MWYLSISDESRALNEPPEVWPEFADALEVFIASLTQWRVSMAGYVGLDYPAVRQVARWLGKPWTRDLFEQIQTAERKFLGDANGRKAS